ncbi:sensor histidine kinase [Kitasatospora sp. CB01950]|uniref:sensor histidine kinase n=1 Tax=Kitasatospora sp. CB01950 TaxID=1703930 RepID=UPI00093C8378|nr:histidine kinase [Kitasatospora sp. CB01950]OKI99886.1 histidine kinase [Kitasatospora sp. CB01950]
MTIPPRLGRLARRARRDTGFLATGVPVHLALVPVWAWGATTTARTGNWALTLPVSAALVLGGVPVLTAVQRYRHRALLGVDIRRSAPVPQRRSPATALRWLFSPRAWRQVGYHLVLGPPAALSELLVLMAAVAGLAGATGYGWMWALPAGVRRDWFGWATLMPCWTVLGLVLLSLLPRLAGVAARAESRSAAALLGPSRADRLQERVAYLAGSRTGLIEAVDAERRRIERDLHDGTQQRLVSLAVNLGLAMATRPDLPGEAREVLAEAHLEAKAAIAELADLVRGLHPAVLEDRGLDAALSGLAARVPLPVRLRVELPDRAAPAVESVAYFVISEALANVTKHADASRVEVTVRRVGTVLRVNVTDDGLGGADPADGTGLSGLAKRVGSVDGAFRLSSPVGGPTTVTVELPCAR